MMNGKHNDRRLVGWILSLAVCCLLLHPAIPHHHLHHRHSHLLCGAAGNGHSGGSHDADCYAPECPDPVTYSGSVSCPDEVPCSDASPCCGGEECILKRMVIRTAGIEETFAEVFPASLLFFTEPACLPEEAGFPRSVKYRPYAEPCFASRVVAAPGLRAPPVA